MFSLSQLAEKPSESVGTSHGMIVSSAPLGVDEVLVKVVSVGTDLENFHLSLR
jgi:hypothetical protein